MKNIRKIIYFTSYLFLFFFCTNSLAADYQYRVEFAGVEGEIQDLLIQESQLIALLDTPPLTAAGLQRRIDDDIAGLLKALQSAAYYHPSIQSSVDHTTCPLLITLSVKTGPIYHFADFIISPTPCQPIFLEDIGIALGDPAYPASIIEAEEDLFALLEKRGYPLARLVKREVIADVANASLSVELIVDFGPQAFFGETYVEGNETLLPVFFCRKIAWQKGCLYNPSLVQRTLAALELSGLFSSITVSHGEEVDEEGLLPMHIVIKEAKQRSIGFGVGYATTLGFGVNAEWEHRNLSGTGDKLSFVANLWQIKQEGFVRYVQPDFLCPRQDLIWAAEVEHEDVKAFREVSFSLSTSIERQLNDRLRISYGLMYTRLRNTHSDNNRTFSLVKIPLQLFWNGANRLMDPTKGITVHLKTTPTAQVQRPCFGYTSHLLTTTAYQPLDACERFVLAGKATLGSIWGASKHSIPPSERFYAGTDTLLRGYHYLTVSPLNEFNKPIGGRSLMVCSLEARMKIRDPFGAVLFYDVGNVYSQSLPQFHHKQLQSAGIGFRYHTPVGPIRLDIAFPFNPRKHLDGPFQVYFSIGQSFLKMWIQSFKGFFLACLIVLIAASLLLSLKVVSHSLVEISHVFSSKPSPKFEGALSDSSDFSFSFLTIPYDFTIEIEREWGGKQLEVKASGSWRPLIEASKTSWSLNLDSCSGTFNSLPFNLLTPTTVSKQTEHWNVNPFSVDLGGGIAHASLSYHQDNVQGFFKWDQFQLSHLPFKLLDLPADAMLSLEGTLAGSPEAPNIHLYLNAADLGSSTEALSKILPKNGQASFSFENGVLAGKGRLDAIAATPIYLDVECPAQLHLHPFFFHIEPSAPLTGNISAEWEIAPWLHALLDTPTTFSGFAKTSLNLTGTYSQPELKGSCELMHGAYEIPEIGVFLTNLSAQIDVLHSELYIKEIQGSDGKTGKIQGTGHYLLNSAQRFPFALNLQLTEATLLNQDYVQVVCNGPLTFKGNLDGGSIEANLEASQATVEIPDRSYSSINTVDVTYVNIPNEMPQPQSLQLQQASKWQLNLNMHLNVPRSLSITGRDLSSTWKGALDIHGTAQKPLIMGEMKVIEGEYLFNGNPFEINQGTLSFAGDIDKKTTLYVIASKDLDKVKVDVIAKGPIKNPEISFRSNPPLPQREILSWILFNRGTSEISSFQGSQLSESITNLTSHQQGPDVLSKIRTTLGIDRFEISRNPQSNSNDVNVQIGKYISDNFLISVIKSDVNQVALEATLSDKIKLQAQVGEDAQGQLLLKWKRDY